MYRLKQFAGYLALGIGLASSQSHASIIRSMTIEEIGVASGGLGTSLVRNGGGRFSFGAPQSSGSTAFGSAGSIDGAIIMESMQGDFSFTPGFLFANLLVTPNTLQGAPTGSIANDDISLDLSGWGVNVPSIGYFPMQPDVGSLKTAATAIDSKRFYYTADWRHTITPTEHEAFAGLIGQWHLEGIATIPEPSTLALLAASSIGLIVARQRKSS